MAFLVQIKMKARALESVVTHHCLKAVRSGLAGGFADEQQKASSDIHDAHVQCQEALLAAVMNKTAPVDEDDI